MINMLQGMLSLMPLAVDVEAKSSARLWLSDMTVECESGLHQASKAGVPVFYHLCPHSISPSLRALERPQAAGDRACQMPTSTWLHTLVLKGDQTCFRFSPKPLMTHRSFPPTPPSPPCPTHGSSKEVPKISNHL